MTDTAHDYDALIAEVRADLAAEQLPDLKTAEQRLTQLRNFSEFVLLIEVAERYILEWPDAAKLCKLYGQALIDAGQPRAGRAVLKDLRAGLQDNHPEYKDVTGVIGRAEKDLFLIAHVRGKAAQAETHAQAAFDAYYSIYAAFAGDNTYHGVNAAALITLTNDEGVTLSGAPQVGALSEDIIAQLKAANRTDPWAAATLAEAHIPLSQWDAVEKHLGEYLGHEDLTKFQVNGTLRQFRDVWRLGQRGKRGQQIIAMLEAAAMKIKTGFASASAVVPQSAPVDIPEASLEKMLGADGLQTYAWLKDGFKRAESVAAVLNAARRRLGTAFVIDPADFDLTVDEGLLCMMTNFHVLNRDGVGKAMSPKSNPRIRFEANKKLDNKAFRIKEILFESPFEGPGLDCTIFTADAKGAVVDPIVLEPDELPNLEEDPKPRVYIIGYPLGGEMQFALQDNRVLDHEGPDLGTPPIPSRQRIHYFAPTEPGNSGSPVFNTNWDCIALHHAGLKHDPEAFQQGMEKLNNKPGFHSANEGIQISSIIDAVKAAQGNT